MQSSFAAVGLLLGLLSCFTTSVQATWVPGEDEPNCDEGGKPAHSLESSLLRCSTGKHHLTRLDFSQHFPSENNKSPSSGSWTSAAPHSPLKGRLPTEINLAVTGGRGLIRAGTPYVLGPGDFGANLNVVNFDRNPGDIDFFDYSFQLALGLGARTSAFFRYSPVLRINSIGQAPVRYPVPPLDLFVDTYPTDATRPEPYFMHAQEAPYKTYFVPNVIIKPPGNGAFAQTTGDIFVGGKHNFTSEERGDRLGFGIRFYAEIPTENPVYNTTAPDGWRHVGGVSGETNIGLDLLFAKRFWVTELLLNAGYKRVGDPSRGLRVQYVDSSAQTADQFLVGMPVEYELDLHDNFIVTAGTVVPVFSIKGLPVWLIGELTYTRYVGSGTRVERLVHPVEIRLAVEFPIPRYRQLTIGIGWQLLFNDAGDGDYRSTFLQTRDGLGDINFSELVDPALSDEVKNFLESQGTTFSYNSNKVFSTNNPAFNAWRNIPTEPVQILGKGGGNWLAFLTWRIASLW